MKGKELIEKGWVRYPCIKEEQPGGTFYTIVMSAKKLADKSVVLSRALDKDGIQRVLKSGHVGRIAKFIKEDGALLVNNVIGNIPDKEKFHYEDGHCYIHPELVPEIIDGQHRLKAFSQEYNVGDIDFPLVFTFLVDVNKRERANLFYKINKEQKKINPTLGYDLLEVIGDSSTKAIAAKISKGLNDDNDSPFFGIVKIKENDTGTAITLATMSYKIEKFLATTTGRHGFLDEKGRLKFEVLFKTLKNYFNAVREIFPDEWEDRKCVINKSLGYGAFIEALPAVLTEHSRRSGYKVPKKEEFLEILKPIEGFDFYDEEISSLGGEKGQKLLAFRMIGEMGFKGFEE